MQLFYNAKKLKISVAWLTLTLMVSCGNDDKPKGPETSAAYLRMKVNGVVWEATRGINNWGASAVIITGRGNGDYPVLSSSIKYNGQTGTFDMKAENSNFFNYQDASGKLFMINKARGRGSVAVTDRKTVNGQVMLTGTFEGTAYTIDETDSIKITDGAFHDDMLE